MKKNKYKEWLENEPIIGLINDKVLITQESLHRLAEKLTKKIEQENSISIDSSTDLEMLFVDIFVKDANEERAVVGNYSISLTKNSVFGLVILTASIIEAAITGFTAISGAFSLASIIQTIKSTIAKLNKDELYIISILMVHKEETGNNPILNQIIERSDYLSKDTIINLLNSLDNKDAIEWNGDLDSEIQLKKWI